MERPEREVFRESAPQRDTKLVPVRIRAGETLCLTSDPAEEGERWDPLPIKNLHLTGDVERARWVLRLVRMRGDLSALVVENRSSDELFLEVASPPTFAVGSFDSYSPDSKYLYFSCHRGPGSLSPKTHETVLLGVSVKEASIRLGHAARPEQDTPADQASKAAAFLADDTGLGIEVGSGLKGLGLSELNRALAENGYASHPSVVVPWAVLLSGQLGPIVLRLSFSGETQGVQQPATGSETDVEYQDLQFEGGFRVRLTRALTLMPYVGIGEASLKLSVPNGAPPILPGQLSAYPTPTTVAYESKILPVGMDFEAVLPVFEHHPTVTSLSLRARAGYSFDLGGDRWQVDSGGDTRALVGGPTPYLGGPFLLLTLGAAWRTRLQ
jgi:hypothetical protein